MTTGKSTNRETTGWVRILANVIAMEVLLAFKKDLVPPF